MDTSLALVRVRYYDEIEDKNKTICGILQGCDMTEIGKELDDWIGDDLISCEIMPLAQGALEITEEMYEALIKEN